MASTEDEEGWYRVCLNTIVRKGLALDSDRLRILPMGSRVHVVGQHDRRVEIDEPIRGFCSLEIDANFGKLIPVPNQSDANVAVETPSSGNYETKLNKEVRMTQNQVDQYDGQISQIASEINLMLEKDKKLKPFLQKFNSIRLRLNNFKLEGNHTGIALSREEYNNLKKECIQNCGEGARSFCEKQDLLIRISDQKNRLQRDEVILTDIRERTIEFGQRADDEMVNMFQSTTSIVSIRPEGEANKHNVKVNDVAMIKGGVGIVVVRYIGQVHFADGVWAGVELSHPVASGCNGLKENKNYFSCPEKCGEFYRLEKVSKVIKPEELLHKLNSLVIRIQQLENSKE